MSLKSKTPIRITNMDLKNGTFVFPDSLTYIDYWAFKECSAVTTVNLSDSVTSIRNGAFKGCISLTTINSTNRVTSISDYAFSKCTSLTTINFSDQLESIGRAAFKLCISLKTFRIPNNVRSIKDYTFHGCTALATINFSKRLKSIGIYAFSGCTALTTLNFPNRLKSIGYNAFSECTALIRVHIPDSVISIDNWAFSGCTALTSIIINTKDKVEFERITQLLPEELRSKAIPSPMYNAQHLMLSRFNARAYPIPSLPTEVISTIFSYDELTSELNFTLSTALQNVPIPTSWDDLTDYKRALRDVLELHWERHQVCVYLNHYKETIKQSAPKHLGFFSDGGRTPQSQQNKAIVELYRLIERLIPALSNPEDVIQLSAKEKTLLLTKPVLMAKIPLAIQQHMGMGSQEQTQVDSVEPISCCTVMSMGSQEQTQVDSVEPISCCTIS